jgi:hypothetical protein
MKKVVLASLLAVAGVAQPSFGQVAPANVGSQPKPAATPAAVTVQNNAAPQSTAAKPVAIGGLGGPQAPGAAADAGAAGPCGVPAKAGGPAAVNIGGGPGAGTGSVQMSDDEYASYNNAQTQKDAAAKAAAFEAYLTAYPKSAVKKDALQQLMFAYSAVPDTAKTQDAADRLLAIDPCNLYAFVFEVALREGSGANATDPAAKQAAYDSAADFAKRGLLITKMKDMPQADFDKLKNSPQGFPAFYSAIAQDDLQKKDNAGAIKAFKDELNFVPLAQTTAPGPQLQDTYYLASAYYTSTPPDFLNCAYYAGRAMNYAPEPFKTTFKQLASYCYKKFHGADDGFDDMVAVAAANLVPPATFSVKPAPTPADIVSNLIATTPDLASLALSDKEYVLQNGKPADADKVFETIKGKSVSIPGAVVISVTDSQITAAVSDDAQVGKTADFTFNFATPLTKQPAVGDKIELSGTYASYTQAPVMIVMSDAAIVEPEKPKTKAAPVHHKATH